MEYSVIIKERNSAICRNMDGCRISCSVNKAERETQIFYHITYTWNLKNKMNIYAKQTQTHWYRKQTTTGYHCGDERGQGKSGGWDTNYCYI